MDRSDLRLLAEFNAWATERVAPALLALAPEAFHRRLESSFPSVHATVAHLVGAAELWLSRWRKEPWSPLAPAESFPREAADLVARWRAVDGAIVAFVATIDDANAALRMTNSKGEPFEHLYSQMVPHLVNHQSYHRGQLVTLLRQLGVKPPSQDLIAFHRTRR